MIQMKRNPLISIIVPVYNAEKYLAQCLDSVVNQTYQELEIICINDGSKDNSIAILNQYRNKDSRIVIFDKSNEGVSATRNYGLKKSMGEYIMFVDADDWIDTETCEKAVSAMAFNDADIVMWTYVSEHGATRAKKVIFPTDIILEGQEVKNKLHRRYIGILDEELAHPEQADSLCPVWGKLYRRSLIERSCASFIELDKIGTYEDGMFNLEVFYYADRVVYLNQSLYHYRRENDFSVTSGYRKQLTDQWKNLFQIMKEYIEKNNLPEQYEKALNNRIVLSILGLGLNISEAEVSKKKQFKMISNILHDRQYQKACKSFEFQHLPLHWKLFYGSAAHGFTLGVYVLLKIIRMVIYG